MSRISEIQSVQDTRSPIDIENGKQPSLLKYDDEAFEIEGHEYIPPKPYYMESNHNYFHLEYTAASLMANDIHPEHHHHHHHLRHHFGQQSTTTSASGVDFENQIENRKLKEMLDILSAFLPPLDFKDANGKFFRRDISTQRAKTSDVKALTEEVEKRLTERCAREVGYCPIRRGIFSDCFDEILRQVILEDRGNGVLLGRIRDELRMTIGCWRRLTQSMDSFSSRKGVQVEATRIELGRLTTEDPDEQAEINRDLIILRRKHADLLVEFKKKELQCSLQNNADIRRRLDELDFFTNISTQLRKQMEQVRANAKEFL